VETALPIRLVKLLVEGFDEGLFDEHDVPDANNVLGADDIKARLLVWSAVIDNACKTSTPAMQVLASEKLRFNAWGHGTASVGRPWAPRAWCGGGGRGAWMRTRIGAGSPRTCRWPSGRETYQARRTLARSWEDRASQALRLCCRSVRLAL